VNGCYFLDSGTVLNTGLQSFKLQGYGKPISPVFGSFAVHFDSTVCSFVIPTDSAVYTFNSPMGSCPNIKVSGKYFVGASLNTADTVSIPIHVSVPGLYFIQTIFTNGMLFSSKGIFTQAGNYNVTLTGSGSPAAKGTYQVPVTIARNSCSFPITSILDTSMYWQLTVESNHYFGLMDSAYGIIGDTGIFVSPYTSRIFAAGFAGGDINGSSDSFGLGIVLSRLNTPLTIGAYHTFTELGEGDFNGFVQLNINNISPSNYYFYASSANLNQFVINVTDFDPVSKLMQGNFSGPVYKLKSVNNQSGPVFNITNGYFKTYMAH
jgi:hypothetical protein